jgi:hypothetical protein
MAKLKLGTIESNKPVRLKIEIPAAIHRDLLTYAQALAQETGQGALDPAKIIPPMLAQFMTTDRGFAKARHNAGKSNKVS